MRFHVIHRNLWISGSKKFCLSPVAWMSFPEIHKQIPKNDNQRRSSPLSGPSVSWYFVQDHNVTVSFIPLVLKNVLPRLKRQRSMLTWPAADVRAKYSASGVKSLKNELWVTRNPVLSSTMQELLHYQWSSTSAEKFTETVRQAIKNERSARYWLCTQLHLTKLRHFTQWAKLTCRLSKHSTWM